MAQILYTKPVNGEQVLQPTPITTTQNATAAQMALMAKARGGVGSWVLVYRSLSRPTNQIVGATIGAAPAYEISGNATADTAGIQAMLDNPPSEDLIEWAG